MSAVKFRVGRRIRSAALVADAWNDSVDVLSAGAALVAVGLATHDPARFLSADHYGDRSGTTSGRAWACRRSDLIEVIIPAVVRGFTPD
jgi:hypothetical protein